MATKTQTDPKKPADVVRYWLAEFKAARKREEKFRKQGEDILRIYDASKEVDVPFNILYSNTETLHPALYSAIPRPVVQRRFKDNDPLGKAAAEAGKRALEFLIDTNVEGYETFNDAMSANTLDALLPGRAVCKIVYDADVYESTDATDAQAEPQPERVLNELICPQTVLWHRFLMGYAKKWSKVPWIAFEEHIDKEEATRLFGEAKAKKLKYAESPESDKEDEEDRIDQEEHPGVRKTCTVYQIWDKDGGNKVRYISEQYKEGFLDDKPDPLKLTGFYPIPKPLQFFQKTHSTVPTALYRLYEVQAGELNILTQRIIKISQAIKARGGYDASLTDLANVMKLDDNELVPVDSSSSIAAEKGFSNAIWFLPLEVLIQTLQQLYVARESCKQTIYEITGIADILRGSTKASETLGAQEIKERWGGLRLKRMQKEVQRYAKDLMRMMLELAASKFPEETWAKMTGLPFDTQVQRMQKQQQLMAMQQQMAMISPPQPGMPPQPNPMQQQLQQLQQALQAPTWQQILAILQDDVTRAYRIDIETNSTLEPDATEDQQNIVELMTALGQFLQAVGPMVVEGVMPFGVAQSMMLVIARHYQFGDEIEEFIQAMQPPATKPPEGDGGAAVAQQMKTAQEQLALKQQQGELDLKGKTMEAEKGLVQKHVDLQLREIELDAREHAHKNDVQSAQKQLGLVAQGEHQKVQHESKVAQLQNSQFKTENVVNKKADETLGKGVKAMQDMVKQLTQTVAKQSNDNQAMIDAMVKALSAPRTKKAIRDKEGRIQAVEEQVA